MRYPQISETFLDDNMTKFLETFSEKLPSCSGSTVGKYMVGGWVVFTVWMFIFSFIQDLVCSLGRDERSNLAKGQHRNDTVWEMIARLVWWKLLKLWGKYKVRVRIYARPYRHMCVCYIEPPQCEGRCKCHLRWQVQGCYRSVCAGSDHRHSPLSTETRTTSRTKHLSLEHKHFHLILACFIAIIFVHDTNKHW